MRVSAVLAASDNGVIGRDGGLPWRVSSDMKLFKEITLGKPVIMGRRTWESLFVKPLPGRRNIVITGNEDYEAPGADLVPSLEVAFQACEGEAEVCIIGGGQIYAAAMARTDRVYLTRIHMSVEGDTYLPDMPDDEWQIVEQRDFEQGERDDAAFSLIVYDRVRG